MSRKLNKSEEEIIKDAKLCYEEMSPWQKAELISWDSLERPIIDKKILGKLAKLNKEDKEKFLKENFKQKPPLGGFLLLQYF